jgi:heme-degrading monooxygenase HmoA
MSFISSTPEPPYYVVIFTSIRNDQPGGYELTALRMIELGSQEEGFLGIESACDTDGNGITVSYWRSLEDIKRWKANAEHAQAQAKGRSTWYSAYKTRIAKVERDYGFDSLK